MDPIYTNLTSRVAPTGVAAPTIASTGVVTGPTATGSPIAYTGAGSIQGVSALGMVVAGGVALVRLPSSPSLTALD
jgi:hypothetical protein